MTDHSMHAMAAAPSRLPLVLAAALLALAALPAPTDCALPLAEPGAVPTGAEIAVRAACR